MSWLGPDVKFDYLGGELECVCNSTDTFILGESIVFSCKVEFYGEWIPNIECQYGENITLVPHRAAAGTLVSSSLNVTTTASMNGAEFWCFVDYTEAVNEDPSGTDEATNVPECGLRHTFPEITVYCTYYF